MEYASPSLFHSAGALFLADVATTLEDFTGDRKQLNRGLITAGMEFNQRWENWLDVAEFDHKATKLFHEMLLRHAKGMIKAYRIWCIDTAR